MRHTHSANCTGSKKSLRMAAPLLLLRLMKKAALAFFFLAQKNKGGHALGSSAFYIYFCFLCFL